MISTAWIVLTERKKISVPFQGKSFRTEQNTSELSRNTAIFVIIQIIEEHMGRVKLGHVTVLE